jgi:hypothetical protein
MTNRRSDQVGDDINARMLIVNKAPKLEFCSKIVERLEPVMADIVMKMQSKNESMKPFCHQNKNAPEMPTITYDMTTLWPQLTPFRADSNQRELSSDPSEFCFSREVALCPGNGVGS